MLPSYQGFESSRRSSRERYDRLKVNPKLLLLDGASQFCLQLEPCDCLRPHIGMEDLIARFAERLSTIHRGIRVAQDIFRPLRRRRTQYNPNTRRDEDVMPTELKWLLDIVLNPVGHLC